MTARFVLSAGSEVVNRTVNPAGKVNPATFVGAPLTAGAAVVAAPAEDGALAGGSAPLVPLLLLPELPQPAVARASRPARTHIRRNATSSVPYSGHGRPPGRQQLVDERLRLGGHPRHHLV